jgi:hypothetical protein
MASQTDQQWTAIKAVTSYDTATRLWTVAADSTDSIYRGVAGTGITRVDAEVAFLDILASLVDKTGKLYGPFQVIFGD